MIRLGSLAGYPFEGPRLLAGWTPPAEAAVYAIEELEETAKLFLLLKGQPVSPLDSAKIQELNEVFGLQ